MQFIARLRWFVLALALLAPACASLQLVDRYDIAIETGINQYHLDVTKFLKEDLAYDSPAAKDFYATATADLANLVVRAQVVAIGGTCTQPKFLDAIMGSMRSGSTLPGLPPSLTADVSLQDGSCTVVALKALQANQMRLEAIHKRNDRLGPFRAGLLSDLIGDNVRIALVIEAAKKP